MDFNYDSDILSMDMLERIREACRQTRQRKEEINALTEQNRDETRPVRIEENRVRIARLEREIEEFDQMTIDSTRTYAERLDNIIQRNFMPNTGRENIRLRAIEVRNELNRVIRENADIFHNEIRVIEYPTNSNDAPVRTEKDAEKESRSNGKSTKTKNDSNDSNKSEKKEKDILNDISNFEKKVTVLRRRLEEERVNFKGISVRISELTKEFDNELLPKCNEFLEEAKNLSNSTLNPKEVENRLRKLKKDLVSLKNRHIEIYNSEVEYLNGRIDELKTIEGLTDEERTMLESLKMNRANVTVKQYNQESYMKSLDYKTLVERLNKIEEFNKNRGKGFDGAGGGNGGSDDNPEPDKEENEFDNIIKHLDVIEDILREGKLPNEDDLNEYYMDLNHYETRVNKLFNAEKINENELDYALDRIDIVRDLVLDYDLNRKEIRGFDIDAFSSEIDSLEEEINHFDEIEVAESIDEMTDKFKNHLLRDVDKYEQRVSDLRSRLEEAKTNGTFKEESQYDALNTRLTELSNKLNETRTRINETIEYNPSVDRFESLETMFIRLENEVALQSEKGKIKKASRRKIDGMIKNIEQMIDTIRMEIEIESEKPGCNKEKIEADKKRLEEYEARLNDIKGRYRNNCPLRVRAWRKAKEIYNKTPKWVLVVGGLAASAALLNIIGPSIGLGCAHLAAKGIPLAGKFGALVAKAIGCTIGPLGQVYTASGTALEITTASASLLKGIAMAGVGTGVVLTPLIVSLRKALTKGKKKEKQATTKINTTSLEEEESENKTRLVDKGKELVHKAKDKVRSTVNGTKSPKIWKELSKQYEKIINISLTNNLNNEEIAELCREEGKNDNDIAIITKYVELARKGKKEGRGR